MQFVQIVCGATVEEENQKNYIKASSVLCMRKCLN